MTPERWKRVTELFEAAVEHEPAGRAAFLAQAAADDPTLAQEVLHLLTSDENASTFLKVPPALTSSSVNDSTMASLPVSDKRALARGDSLGRYIIIEMIGSGGMGVVYAAYDPELDRKLAIKLLRPEASKSLLGTDARARLLREAQVMARLSHNNVVNVHDVGTIGDEVFIAMEYVEGCTLKQWLDAELQKWPEIVAMFVQAGRGLSAAHSAGIVHRDFKSLNVLVGKDGRARVVDFGLARGTVSADAAQTVQILPDGLKSTSSGPKALASDLTKTGMLMGTPAYMAPEQIAGGKLDERTDQFSFCAALYHALCGELPFGGDTMAERLAAIREGRLTTPKASANVPAWVRQVVVQGLSSDPAARHPSMDVLLHKLQQNPAKLWRRAGAIAAIVLLATVTPWASYRVVVHRQSLLCRGAQDKLTGVWDSAKQEAIRTAFLSTAKPYAGDAFNGVKRALDRQTQAWVSMHTEACQATRLRGEQSEALLDLRMGCLRNRLDEMRALTNLFVQADAQVVEKSVQATEALVPLRGCSDADALTAQVKPPKDAAVRAQVEKHRNTLAEIKALNETGKYARGLEMANPLLEAVRATGYKPLEAETLFIFGVLLETTNQIKKAEEILYQAAASADEVRDDTLRAQAWSKVAYVVGYRESRMEDGLRIAKVAEAAIKRVGNPPELDSRLQQSLGIILTHQGKYNEGLQHLKQALDIRQKAFGPETPIVATTLNSLGGVLSERGQYEEALTYLRKALHISENALGAEHPSVAFVLTNLGNVLGSQSKFDAALEVHRRALAIYEKAFGPDNIRVAGSLENVGVALGSQGRYAEAAAFYRRGLEIREKARGGEHAELVGPLINLGAVFGEMGDLEASLAYSQRALAIAEKAFGPEHPTVAELLNNLGATFVRQGSLQAAVEHLRRSLAIKEKVLGAEHPDVAITLVFLGSALHQQNKRENFDVAAGYMNRALAIREKTLGPDSPGVAEILVPLGVLESQRKQTKGLAHLQRALDIREKTLRAEDPLIGLTLRQMGEAYLNRREPLEAKPRLERASKLLQSSERDPSDLAITRFLLARALWDTHSDRERAITLAQQARTVLLKAGRRKSENLREVEAWLSSRLRPRADLSEGASKEPSALFASL